MKRIVSMFLILSMMLALIPASLAVAEEPIELHFVTRGVTLAGDEENLVKQKLEEKFNVKIKWELLPSTNYREQVMSYLAGDEDDYPDLMEYQLNDLNELQGFIEDGILMPLNDLLDTYGQNILAARPNEANWYTYEDGERYSIAARWTNVPETFYTIRKDWLDYLQLEMPTTLDELVDVAYQFTYNDPDGNGVDDTYGFGCALTGKYFDAMMPVLGAYGVVRDWMPTADGTYVTWQITDECKEAIKYFKKNIYEKGLVDPNFMLLSRNEYLENKYLDKYGIEYWYLTHTTVSGSSWWKNYMEYVPWNETVTLKPVSQEGYETVLPATISAGSATGFTLFLFENCEHPEKVIEILNYLATDEGANLVALGIEGLNYDIVDGKYVERELSQEELRNSGKGLYTTTFWYNIYKMDSSELTLEGLASLEGYTRQNLYMPYAYDGDVSALNGLLNSQHVAMIIDPEVDVDTAFEAMKQQYMDMGGAEYTQWYNEKLKELGYIE